MRLGRFLTLSIALPCLSFVTASWTKRHMEKEHHVEHFDPTSFFVLHDLDHDGHWTENEVRTLYGLHDASISPTRAQAIINAVFSTFEKNVGDVISKSEFVDLLESGGDLPDCEFDGHHGDEEYEFEIHHVEQFHADDERDESEWDHPEDIEHFRKHEENWREEHSNDPWKNIPEKFRRVKVE